jgi:hypothetical protein
MAILQNLSEDINSGKLPDISGLDERRTKLINALSTPKEKVAYFHGCTLNLTSMNETEQIFYICEGCENETDEDDLLICQCCAMFCHAGHKLKPFNLGRPHKALCDCGSGKLNESKFINNNNPLKKAGDKLDQECSIVFIEESMRGEEVFNECMDQVY